MLADSRLHEALREGLEEMPPGVQIAVLSRSDPPPELARHRANQALVLLPWDELRLTGEEAVALAGLRGTTQAAPAVLERAQGWAAGLVLLLEGTGAAPAATRVSQAAPEAVFDYFAGEIFRRAERKTQDFLMESAFLPRMMPNTVAALTAHRDAERILEDLARIALAWAPQFTRQGRVETVQRWLDELPASVLEISPWLLYWSGECRLMSDAPASRPYFERALTRFRERRDATGVYLSWIREVASFRLDPTADMRLLDPWIALFDELIREYSQFTPPEIEVGITVSMLLAMVMRQPQNPAMRRWEARAVALLQVKLSPTAKVELAVFLMIYHCLMGQHAQATLELEAVRAAAAETEVPVLLEIYRYLGEALYDWACCRFEDNLAACARRWNSPARRGSTSGITNCLPRGCGERSVPAISRLRRNSWMNWGEGARTGPAITPWQGGTRY